MSREKARGLKPASCLAPDAALKRRSSTVLLTPVKTTKSDSLL
jgi:hypothetical protein